jgi:pyruvate dehydrogenase E1 component alpha subunit
MRADGDLDDDRLAALETEVAATVARAIEVAEQGPLEPLEELTRFVSSDPADREVVSR